MKRIVLTLLVLLFFTSCSIRDDSYYANKKLANLNSYSAVAEIKVYGNKAVSEYKVKQYFVDPDKLRIETIEPGFLNGKTFVYDGGRWKIYHPLINSTLEVEKLKGDEDFIYLGVINRATFLQEGMKYKTVTKNGVEYIEVKCSIPHGNEYRKSAILYITKEEYCPEYMEIFDDKGELKVEIRYKDFDYNCSLKDSLFKLN